MITFYVRFIVLKYSNRPEKGPQNKLELKGEK